MTLKYTSEAWMRSIHGKLIVECQLNRSLWISFTYCVFLLFLKSTVAFVSGDAYVFTDVRDHGWAQGIVRNENLSVDL